MKRFFSKIPKSTKALLLILVIWIISAQNSHSLMTIDSLDPGDNGNVSSGNLGNNLVINFSSPPEVVNWTNGSTGTIGLYFENGSGTWSLVESYGVNSGNISGKNTDTLTINPTNNLVTNRCYKVIVNTCSVINKDAMVFGSPCEYMGDGVDYLVISGESWSFTTGSGSCSGGSTWYNGNWLYRKKFTVQHSKVNGDLTDFPVYLKLNDFGDSFFNTVKNDGSDIVITSSDKVTKLSRELEFINTTANTGALWFKAGNLYNTSNTDFYMYYGFASAAETNSTSTWKSSYKTVAHLQETPTASNTDTEFQDSTSNNIDVKSQGTMGSGDKVAGQIGNGTDLDGTDDYLDFGNITSISQANSFTLSAWLKPIGTSGYLPIFAKGTTSVISLMHDGTNWRGTSNSNGNDGSYHTKNLARNTNWIYSVMVYDSSLSGNDRFKIYVNGNVLTGMTFSTIETLSGGDGANLFAGRQNSTNYAYYGNGDLDELRVSTSAHTAPWIKTEYLNQFSPSTFYTVGSQESSDTTNPTVSSFSPADNSTNVAIDANLIINFSENVDTQTGNLVIKKSSDNSTFQTISITSATGNGTSSLTFIPNDFANNTSYYVQIDATAVDDLFGNSYAGISDTTTWNFTTNLILSGWMDHNWLKRVKFTIDDSKVNGSVTDFPVYLKLSDFSSVNLFNNTRTDGADIRITQGDGLSVLASELVQYNAVANLGELHFKAPHLSNTANMDFYMYYDNANARPINASDPLGKHDVWSNGFVAVYHMQENPNGDPSNSIYNSARNKYYGKPYGSMTSADRVAGQMGNGTDFDGTDDYYETDDISEIDNATKLTYSMWFKRRNSGSKILIDKSTSSSMTEVTGIHVWNSGNVHLQWRKGAQNEATYSSNDTSWHHVMSVFNGSGISSVTKIIGFHDGTSKSLSYSGALPTKLPINSSRFLIGKRHYDASFSDGYMDEIRVASKVRSSQWAKTEFNNQNSPSTFYTVSLKFKTNYNNRPQISSLYPRNQATQIPRKANLKIVFDGTISANTGNITIKKVSDNSTFATIAIGSGNVSISGSTLTIDPSSDLAANTEYYVLMDADILRGTCGTSACGFSGISLPRGWRFKTTGSHIKEVIFHDTGF
jgi:methionine-rich copper-binding protein CopC